MRSMGKGILSDDDDDDGDEDDDDDDDDDDDERSLVSGAVLWTSDWCIAHARLLHDISRRAAACVCLAA